MNEAPSEETLLRNAAVIPFALLGGATVFLIVVIFITLNQGPSEGGTKDPLLWIGLTLGLWLVLQVAAKLVVKFREPLLLGPDAAQQYLQTIIMKLALHEGPTMVGMVSLLICLPGNLDPFNPLMALLLIPYLTMLATVVMQRPGPEDFQHQVQLAAENDSMRRKQS